MKWYEEGDTEWLTTRGWCVYQFDYELPRLFEGYLWQQATNSSREEVRFYDSYEEAEKAYRALWDEVTECEEWLAKSAA